MRVLIAGLGSIGRRHLRNLQALGEHDLILYRTHRGSLPEADLAGLPVETDLESALGRGPEAVVVCNPTSLHLEVAIPAARAGCHLLIEKPISHSLEGVEELLVAQRRSGSKILVGFQFRFHPLLRRLRESVVSGDIGRPRWAHAHYAEYLPAWHPYEDYRSGYSARAELGGGALLTLCHPFDYLSWLLGPLTCDAARVSTIGAFPIDVDDCADVWLSARTGARASVHLDYYERPPGQWMSIAGDAGWLRCDFLAGRLEGWSHGGRTEVNEWVPAGWKRNDMFHAEMAHFLHVCQGIEEPSCDLTEGLKSLAVVLAARSLAAAAPGE